MILLFCRTLLSCLEAEISVKIEMVRISHAAPQSIFWVANISRQNQVSENMRRARGVCYV